MTYEFKTRPYTHQKDALRAGLDRDSYAYLMEMGTGKTKVDIDDTGVCFDRGTLDAWVILAPKGVYMNWILREIPTHLSTPARVVPWVSGGNKSQQADLENLLRTPASVLPVLVVNVEALSQSRKVMDYLERFYSTFSRVKTSVDEATVIKNPDSSRHKKVLKLRDMSVRRRILTGSLITKSPMDAFGQFRFLGDGLIGPKNQFAFRARYCVLRDQEIGGRKIKVEIAPKNLEDLAQRVEQHSFRVRKEECLDLPPKVFTTRDVELTGDQRRIYSEIREQAFSLLSERGEFVSTQEVITQMLRLHQVVCGHVRDDDGDDHDIPTNRLDVLMETVQQAETGTIIWARYRRDLAKIADRLRESYGAEAVAEYHGGNNRDREADAERFISSDRCQFMVSNPQTGGYGNTWLKGRTVVYYSNSYSLEHRLQSEDRSHRSGQEGTVTYVDLVARGTVDEKILKALRSNIDLASRALGEELREWVI